MNKAEARALDLALTALFEQLEAIDADPSLPRATEAEHAMFRAGMDWVESELRALLAEARAVLADDE